MNLLLDTHILIWAIQDNPKLPSQIRTLILSADRVAISIASLWECSIKIGLNKLEMDLEKIMGKIESLGFEILPIKPEHLVQLMKLPMIHRDPFDRLLVAQAKTEPLLLQTVDPEVLAYL